MENIRRIGQSARDRAGSWLRKPQIATPATPRMAESANSTQAARFVAQNIDALPAVTEFQPYMRKELGGLMGQLIHAIVNPVDGEQIVDRFSWQFLDQLSMFDAYTASLPEDFDFDALDPRKKVANSFGATVTYELDNRYSRVFAGLRGGLEEAEEPSDFLRKVFDRYIKIFPLYQGYLYQFGAATRGEYDTVIQNAMGGEVLTCKWLYQAIPRLHTLQGMEVADDQRGIEYGGIYRNSYPSVAPFARLHINNNSAMDDVFRWGLTDEELLRFFEIKESGAGKQFALKVPAEEVQMYALEKTKMPPHITDIPGIECPAMAVVEKGNAVRKIFDMFAQAAPMLYDHEYGITYPRRTREQALAIKPFFIPDF